MKQLFLVCMTTVCLLSFQTIQGQQVVPAQGAQMIPAKKMQMTLAQPDGIAFRELSFANALKMAKEEEKVRPMGRTASGVKGISLDNEGDEVIGMICIESGKSDVLVVSENGYGKRRRDRYQKKI